VSKGRNKSHHALCCPRKEEAENLFVRSPVTALIVLLAVALVVLRLVPLLI
jgi:hypothetical protein